MARRGQEPSLREDPEADEKSDTPDEEEAEDDGEDEEEDEDEDDEFSAEHKAVLKQYNEQVKAMHTEMENAGRAVVRVGGVSEECKSLEDVHKQIQFLSVTDAEAKFVERFMSQLARIGDDIETEDQLDEVAQAIEDENAPEPEGGGFTMMTTRHSYMFAAIFDFAIKKVQEAVRKKKWSEVWQRLVSILLALYNFDNWLADTEEPGENNKLLKRIGTQFEKLLATKEEGNWPAAERDFEACKAALQIVNDHMGGFETGDEPGYKLPVKGVVRQKRGRN